MRRSLDSVATWAMVGAALVLAGTSVYRLAVPQVVSRRYVVDESGPPFFVRDWQKWAAPGIRIGREDAPITFLEFADFECPFCRRFHAAYLEAKRELGDSLALVFVHFPLRRHKFAVPAGRAAECAAARGRFAQYHDVLFQKQDSLGLKSWASFGIEAGIRDSEFQACASDTAQVARIKAGEELGRRVGVLGTPTVLINGWRFPVAPYDTLAEIGRNALRRSAPFQGRR